MLLKSILDDKLLLTTVILFIITFAMGFLDLYTDLFFLNQIQSGEKIRLVFVFSK